MLDWSADLAQRQQQGLHRQRHCITAQHGARVQVDGQWLINFSSNDYLGLSQHPKVRAAAQQAIATWGVGGGASALVAGYKQPQQQFEEAIAEWLGFERGLLFANGYAANLGVLSALLPPDATVFCDRENHASLIDGVRLSGVRCLRYRRHRIAHLAQRVAESANPVVVSDTVFSMSGAIAPLPELLQQLPVSTPLILDDAHGLGVLGEQGRGTLSHFAIDPQRVSAYVCPLGKAMGGYGAMVLGSAATIERCVQAARSLIYSTAPPPALAAAGLAALRVCQNEPEWLQRLHELQNYCVTEAKRAGVTLQHLGASIMRWHTGSVEKALAAANSARAAGLWCVPMRPPTVPQEEAGLRITLTAQHSKSQIEQLIEWMVSHAAEC